MTNYDNIRALLSSLRAAIKVKDEEYIKLRLSELKECNFNGLEYLHSEYMYLQERAKIYLFEI